MMRPVVGCFLLFICRIRDTIPTKGFSMRYTADEERNKRCRLGKNYHIDEDKKLITYNPSENHYGERDYTTIDSVRNMLDIIAQEKGYAIEATINGAHFIVRPGMDFDAAWRAFKESMDGAKPVEKNTAWAAQEEARLATVKSIDTAEVMSMLSGIFIPGVDFDNPDIKHVLKNMRGYQYDDNMDVKQNIIAAFPQYPLAQIADLFKHSIQMQKAKGADLAQIANREHMLRLAKLGGVPERLSENDGRTMGLDKHFTGTR